MCQFACASFRFIAGDHEALASDLLLWSRRYPPLQGMGRFIGPCRQFKPIALVQRRQLDLIMTQRLSNIEHRLIEEFMDILVIGAAVLGFDVGHHLIMDAV